ncbi:MAG: hypothetical protein Q8L48_04570 [Archangium sp.]|nr:hypothetical protein [Archangium sp.]
MQMLYPHSFTRTLRPVRGPAFETAFGIVVLTTEAVAIGTEWTAAGGSEFYQQTSSWYRGSQYLGGTPTDERVHPAGTNNLYLQFTDSMGRPHYASTDVVADDSLFAALVMATIP